MTSPAALPERVRARVLSYAADALGALPIEQVPGPLKRAASFTPQRRARVAGPQILDALGDDGFRQRIGVQARARQGEVAALLDDGAVSVDTAALAFLLRPDGWQDLVAQIGAQVAADEARAGADTEELQSLRRRLDAALGEQAALKQAAKADALAAKAEIADLRRKLGEARSRTRATQAALDRAAADATERTAALEREVASAHAEIRRLKAQVVGVESELARAQRAARVTREEGTMRARLLLDTLLQAGQGLRQELALPVVDGAPADQVEAHLAESGQRESSGTASLAVDDPALLRELLALPQLHLIVDGYNVTRSQWDDTALETQRARLLRGVAPLAARSAVEITVVFDGANAETRPVVQQPRGVRVLFSPKGVLADDVIRDLVAAEPPGRPVAVVTSDQAIVRDVTRRTGVRAVGSGALARLLAG